MNLATRIQHHPSRAREAAQLLERLDGLDPVIVRDPGGPKTSTWRTHRLCLESITDETHLLVIQDDAWPCDRFPNTVHAAISERPDSVICLFAPGASPVARGFNMARRNGQHWMPWRITAYVPLVATVYPAAVAREIPGFADSRRMSVGRADDAVVAAYARAHPLQVWATVPCLVEHRDELVSIMKMPNGKGSPHRVAAWFQQDGGIWGDIIRATV